MSADTPDTPAQRFPEMPADERLDLREALEVQVAMAWVNDEGACPEQGRHVHAAPSRHGRRTSPGSREETRPSH